jgi:CheY-like chemotaxis protein
MIGTACPGYSGPMANACAPRVLFIDDDPNLCEIVGCVLTSLGYDCQVTDSQSGLGRFTEGDWDLVLTDLTMPEGSGWEVIEAIRQRAPTIPVVLMTGLSNPAVLRRARECRVLVILKPFYVQTLKAALVEALRQGSGSAISARTP